MKEMNEKMGAYKFRLSDIMPHSWLYNKLKGISSRKHLPSSPKHLSSDASSSRKLRDPHPHPQLSSPPKSSFKRRVKRKTVYKPSSRLKPSSLKSHVSRNPRSNSINLDPSVSVFSRCASSPSHQGYEFSVRTLDDVPEVTIVSDVQDPPLPVNSCLVRVENVKEPPFEKLSLVARNLKTNNFSGIRLRVNSAKIARKKMKERASPVSKKIEIAESFAIVLSSVDPEKDFRESMVEMIMENNIREQKDLEDLLACYLSLNSIEYHDVIIKAFQKTWFHLTHLSL